MADYAAFMLSNFRPWHGLIAGRLPCLDTKFWDAHVRQLESVLSPISKPDRLLTTLEMRLQHVLTAQVCHIRNHELAMSKLRKKPLSALSAMRRRSRRLWGAGEKDAIKAAASKQGGGELESLV